MTATTTSGEPLSRDELLGLYDEVDDFQEGLARARKGLWRFHIHPDGSPAYEERYADVSPFANGMAWVSGEEFFHIKPDGTRF